MQLLLKRINNKRLLQALQEQSAWALLEDGLTFLQGVGLLARWARLSWVEGTVGWKALATGTAGRLVSGDTATLTCVPDAGVAVGTLCSKLPAPERM